MQAQTEWGKSKVFPSSHRYFSDICLYCLEVLQLMTLSPLPRRDLIASSSSSSARLGSHQPRSGMAVLLHAASTGNASPFYGLADPEVRELHTHNDTLPLTC